MKQYCEAHREAVILYADSLHSLLQLHVTPLNTVPVNTRPPLKTLSHRNGDDPLCHGATMQERGEAAGVKRFILTEQTRSTQQPRVIHTKPLRKQTRLRNHPKRDIATLTAAPALVVQAARPIQELFSGSTHNQNTRSIVI